MSRFIIELKNEKQKSYKRVRYFISVLNAAFFIFYAIETKQNGVAYVLISLMVLLAGFSEDSISKNLNNKIKFSIVYVLLVIVWIKVNAWIALVHLFLLLADVIVRKIPETVFSDNEIIYPSFPAKKIQWNELENVILKDGILTIDFKNNKLLQAEIADTAVDVAAFNQYCKEQLKLSN